LCASGTIDLDISTCGTVSKSGSTITVSNVVVQNIGTAIATSNVLAYYLSEDITINNDDYLIGTDDLGALAVNATSTKSIVKDVSTITNPQIPAGTYYVGMLVYDSTFSEFNQNNNVCYDSSPKFTVTYGCKDITAYNYNPDETYTDNTTCQTCSVVCCRLRWLRLKTHTKDEPVCPNKNTQIIHQNCLANHTIKASIIIFLTENSRFVEDKIRK